MPSPPNKMDRPIVDRARSRAMVGKDRDWKAGTQGSQAASELDLAGGVEGGMESGSAGGPDQEDLENPAKAKSSHAGDDASPAAGDRQKVTSDMGQGSFEQSVGGPSRGRDRS
jgi:hypothetical protein